MPAPARFLLPLCLLLIASGARAVLPAVPEPVENPVTEEKRVLGKVLFWDEQLSSDDTVACGTCHIPAAGGADPRVAFHPGDDGVLGTADDVRGSLGVVRRDATGTPVPDPIFGFGVQVTERASMSFFGALWAPEVLWDGRAAGQFIDPLDGVTVLIASGGGLENQALLPILSDVEMAKEGRTWLEVTSKLASVTPLALATGLPADVAAALVLSPTYPDLFADAFGDSAITPARIAFALASYQRTLVPDQTPFDLGTLTPDQQDGLQFIENNPCRFCHEDDLLSDNTFRNIGLRDPAEDLGRESVTGSSADRGEFKVPSLRNVGLRPTYMHTGQFETLAEVLTFYETPPVHTENIDDDIPIDIGNEAEVLDFLTNGLTDPRVASETFPFDRPILAPEPSTGVALCAGVLLLLALRRTGTSGS